MMDKSTTTCHRFWGKDMPEVLRRVADFLENENLLYWHIVISPSTDDSADFAFVYSLKMGETVCKEDGVLEF